MINFKFGPDTKFVNNNWWKLETKLVVIRIGWYQKAFLRVLIRTYGNIYEIPILPLIKVELSTHKKFPSI